MVANILLVSDYFILASLQEGFGRVFIEAQQCGLLPIVHNYPITKEVLGKYAVYANLTEDNQLKSLLQKVDDYKANKVEIWKYAYEKYSWASLRGKYIELITNLL